MKIFLGVIIKWCFSVAKDMLYHIKTYVSIWARNLNACQSHGIGIMRIRLDIEDITPIRSSSTLDFRTLKFY